MVSVLILNGPNLGRLGVREPEVYGVTTLAEIGERCHEVGQELGMEAEFHQTDSEAELLGWLHKAADRVVPVILNAGAWTHSSIAIGDACAMLRAPLVEVHLSNVYQREAFRHRSYISVHADAVLCGMKAFGYEAAMRYIHTAIQPNMT